MDKKIKLLIVDDEKNFIDALAKRLEMRGFDVTKAYNGQEALDAAKVGKFDLALLDLKMPGMNGDQVLALLKDEHQFLEVIMLTGHGSLDSAVNATKLGAFDYLPKPYELDNLIETLHKAYEHRMKKKFEADIEMTEKIMKIVTGDSPLGIMKRLREIDDDEK